MENLFRPDVSIVICTCRAGVGLPRLLDSLRRQSTSLHFEIIVVENGPEAGNIEPASGVRWILERQPGLSHARNIGILAANAPVVAFLDDDMEAPPNWLDDLAQPILHQGFDAVTGGTLPLKLETDAEILFEAYGGHGHSGEDRVYDASWLARHHLMLPLWQAGGLGNSALRRGVFDRTGYFDEALGAGTPAGSWEDLDMIYRMLSSGCRLLHRPSARVLHAHREEMSGLSRQLCAYRRGEVCFCLLVAKRHHDLRAISHLMLWIPYWRATLLLRELGRRLQGKRLFRFDLMGREMLAYASGPAALAASWRRATLQSLKEKR